jgi:hypothetical protein
MAKASITGFQRIVHRVRPVVGVVGLLVGMAIDGRLDVTSLLGRGRDR